MDIEAHEQTNVVRECIFLCIKEEERGQVCISKPTLRQKEGRIVVENFDTLCVSKLIKALPNKCRVYTRAPPTGVKRLTLSRLEIYYPLESFIWRWKYFILTTIWVIFPILLAFLILLH